jgi:glycosyltransferase involved in cell wall biosynthesis
MRFEQVSINGVFLAQELTGQQRYAAEITRCLASPHAVLIKPPSAVRQSAVLRHAWTNVAFSRTRTRAVLSLTHQIPILRPRAHTEIITIHDLFPITHPEWYREPYRSYARRSLLTGLGRADIVLTVSEATADAVRDSSAARGEVHVVPNAPADIFQGHNIVAGRVLEEFGLTEGEYVFALGSTDPRKRIDLIRAAHSMSQARDLPIVLAGRTSATLNRTGSPVTNDPGCLVLGDITDATLAVLYSGAAVYVSASVDEGFGLPALEAACAGARVVVPDIPVYRWTLGGHATFFEPGAAEALADGIDRAMSRPSQPPYFSRFSYAASAALLDRLIDRIMDS